MNPSLLLRIASALALIHFAGHTFGGMLSGPTHGPEEIAVLETMKAHRFDFMGSLRSYWDFWFGLGMLVSVNLLIQAVVFWQLATLAKVEPRRASPLIASFLVTYLAMAALAWRYFFIGPVIVELAIVACLGFAFYFCIRRTSAA